MLRRNAWDRKNKIKKLEPVSGTSRRGARAAYHDEYPRDFGSRIAYTVSLVSDTSRPPIRQGGREMSAPGPYETSPFHPLALFAQYTMINFYIYTKLFQLFLPCGIYSVSWNIVRLFFTHARFQKPLISRFSVILKSFCSVRGKYLYEIKRNTDKTRYRCIAIWRWRNQRVNFASLLKELVSAIPTWICENPLSWFPHPWPRKQHLQRKRC